MSIADTMWRGRLDPRRIDFDSEGEPSLSLTLFNTHGID